MSERERGERKRQRERIGKEKREKERSASDFDTFLLPDCHTEFSYLDLTVGRIFYQWITALAQRFMNESEQRSVF